MISYAVFAALAGIFGVLLFCLGLGVWAERHGTPPVDITADYWRGE